jgi:hypothetical protein
MRTLTFVAKLMVALQVSSCNARLRCAMCLLVWAFVLLAHVTFAQAEMVSIKWKPSAPIAWVPGNDFIDGYSANFKNATVEEKGKTQKAGELEAEVIIPRGTKGPIPFVIMLHGCSGMNPTLKKWAHEYGGKFVGAGYGVLILDSFGPRGVVGNGICDDPSQLQWARRRVDDAYSALDWLIETGKADAISCLKIES